MGGRTSFKLRYDEEFRHIFICPFLGGQGALAFPSDLNAARRNNYYLGLRRKKDWTVSECCLKCCSQIEDKSLCPECLKRLTCVKCDDKLKPFSFGEPSKHIFGIPPKTVFGRYFPSLADYNKEFKQ